jgi:hypothetical protein
VAILNVHKIAIYGLNVIKSILPELYHISKALEIRNKNQWSGKPQLVRKQHRKYGFHYHMELDLNFDFAMI